MNATAILIIAIGALTLVIGFFGCCGAIKENRCMVLTVSGNSHDYVLDYNWNMIC